MLGPLRSAVAALVGRESDAGSTGECDDAEPGDGEDERGDEDDDRVDGSGRAILDEVYGQPAAAREVERIERQARKLEDDPGRR